MRRISKITQSILAQNAGRDFERLTMKLKLLRQDPFAIIRGTNPLFLDFLPRTHRLFRARWSREADRLGERVASRMQRAWKLYSKDYDAGAVGAVLIPP